jgi:hypothetical protein
MMSRIARISLTLAVAAFAVSLTGCATAAQPTSGPSARKSGSSSAPPSPSLSPRDRCNPNQGEYTTDDKAFADMRDLGTREYAMGEATFNKQGKPASYVVVAGDAEIAISQRFCLTREELWGVLNVVRFCKAGYDIQPGDVLNLDPATVDTVGKRNGQCYGG